MKKISVISIAVVLAALIVPACGKIKTPYVPAQPDDCTDSEIMSPYSACFSFENGTTDGINFDAASPGTAFTDETVTTDHRYVFRGTRSVKLSCAYIGAYTGASASGDISRKYPQTTNVDMTGKILTAYVWIPRNMNSSNIPYGMFFYVMGYGPGGEWSWYQGAWQNLNMPNPPAEGEWNSITARVDEMVYSSSVTMTAANSTRIHQWGLKILKGCTSDKLTSAPDFTGNLYIDSISVTGEAPAPTATLTSTPAITPTETPMDTVTLTPTVTPTVTETDVDTATETPTITETTADTATETPTVTETVMDTPTPTPTATP